jgi:hypothetical protein
VAWVVFALASIPVGATFVVLNGMVACESYRWNCGFTHSAGVPVLVFGGPALVIAAAVMARAGRKMLAVSWAALAAVTPLWGYVAAIALTY